MRMIEEERCGRRREMRRGYREGGIRWTDVSAIFFVS